MNKLYGKYGACAHAPWAVFVFLVEVCAGEGMHTYPPPASTHLHQQKTKKTQRRKWYESLSPKVTKKIELTTCSHL